MSEQTGTIVTLLSAVLASGGLWALIQARMTRKDATRKMLEALAHDRILHVGGMYLRRGSITLDELENLEMLYEPYAAMGGNGSAKRIMEKVATLQVRPNEGR